MGIERTGAGTWEIRRAKDGSGDIRIKAAGSQNVLAEVFAEVNKYVIDKPAAKANAAFIIIADHHFDAAVAVLEKTLGFILATATLEIRELRPDWYEITEHARAVLEAIDKEKAK